MYYYLKGVVVEQLETKIIVDVHGVGYGVLVMHPENFPLNLEQLIYTEFIVKEDEQYLVGFESLEEKDLFNKLISVKGIGPKTALGALREISVESFLEAIYLNDTKRLTKLPGIGPKAAMQIILDLKGTLKFDTAKKLNKNKEEAREALKALGFKNKDVVDVLSSIENENLSSEIYIKEALKKFKR